MTQHVCSIEPDQDPATAQALAVEALDAARDVFRRLAQRFEDEDRRDGRSSRSDAIYELRSFGDVLNAAARRLRDQASTRYMMSAASSAEGGAH